MKRATRMLVTLFAAMCTVVNCGINGTEDTVEDTGVTIVASAEEEEDTEKESGRYNFNHDSGFDGTIQVFDGWIGYFKVPVTIDGNYKSIYDLKLEYTEGKFNVDIIATEDREVSNSMFIIRVDGKLQCKLSDFSGYDLGKNYSKNVRSILLSPDLTLKGLQMGLASKIKTTSVHEGDTVLSCVIYPTVYSIGSSMKLSLADNNFNIEFSENRDLLDLDINQDGGVNAQDAAIILQHSAIRGAGLDDKKYGDRAEDMDVNQDGVVNATDASQVLMISALSGTGDNYSTVDEYMVQMNEDRRAGTLHQKLNNK